MIFTFFIGGADNLDFFDSIFPGLIACEHCELQNSDLKQSFPASKAVRWIVLCGILGILLLLIIRFPA